MEIIPLLIKELEQEAVATRKHFEIVPEEKFDWKPHDKNMTLLSLATHTAQLPAMIAAIIGADTFDLSDDNRKTPVVASAADLTALFEASTNSALDALTGAKDDDLKGEWTMSYNGHVLRKSSKYEAIRNFINHHLHHRAQIGLYLRLLDIPVPGSYGPSADES